MTDEEIIKVADAGDTMATPRDWRGVPIEIGDGVLYATGTGSSKQMVEGEVVNLSPLQVRVVRRSSEYGRSRAVEARSVLWPRRDVVTLHDAKTLTVVEGLPEFAG